MAALPQVSLHRFESSDQGTVSRLTAPGGFSCFAIEPPWRNNKRGLSCLPLGEYLCRWHKSPRYGWVYLVTGTGPRAWILVHPGNFGGDKNIGYKTHTLGCLLLGKALGRLKGPKGLQRAVLTSRPTVRRFFERMGQQSFVLNITGVAG